MKEKYKLIIELYRNYLDTMKPYKELLGEGLSPICDAWYEDIYRVGEFIGVSRDEADACVDFCYEGYCCFILEDGTEYKANTLDEFVYVWEH